MKKTTKKPAKIIVGLLIVGLFLVIYSWRPKSKEQYYQITPKRQSIQSNLILAGTINAAAKTSLHFQTAGQLAWVGVKVGDRVKKYQAIASLDKTQLKKNLEQQFLNYKNGLSTFNDTQDTYKTNKENSTLTEAMKRILERSQNALDNAVINYELADLTIKYATIVSPIAGIVTDVPNALPGTNITPLDTAFTVVDPATIYFRSEIDQENVNQIKIGQAAKITLDSSPDDSIESQINFISFTPVAGQTSTVYEVRFDLPINNQDLTYRLGMTGDAEIITQRADNVLTVPIEAVFEKNNKKMVLVKTGSQQIEKEVVTGIESETDIEIKSGLSEYDQVLIKK